MLWLFLWDGFFLLFINLLGLWLWLCGSRWLGLLLSSLLLWWSILDGLINELELSNNGRVDWRVVDGAVPSDEWVVSSTKLGIEDLVKS
jgi:hypothetical protein